MKPLPMAIRHLFYFNPIWIVLSVLALAHAQSSSAEYSWLNGKWEGTPPLGGSYLMELQVTNGNQIKGTGNVQNLRNRAAASITGTVNGTNVDLEVSNRGPRGSSTVKYVLTYSDGVLKGKGTNVDNGNSAETTFKKTD